MGLSLTAALSGCGNGGTVDLEFAERYHLAGEELQTQYYLPLSSNLEVWGLAGGAFRTVELKNRGTLIQGEDAPEGDLWYRFNGQWIQTRERAVLWDSHAWGRTTLTDTPANTEIGIGVQNLAPWRLEEGSQHALNVWGSGRDYAFAIPRDSVPADAEQTSVSFKDLSTGVEGVSGLPLPAYRGSEGDAIHFGQMQEVRLSDVSGNASFEDDRLFSVVRGAVYREGLHFPDGTEKEPVVTDGLAVTLAEGNTRSLDVDLRGSGFDDVVNGSGGVVGAESSHTRILVRPDLLGGVARTEAGSLPFVASARAATPAEGSPLARVSWSDAASPGAPLQFGFFRTYLSNGFVLEAGVVRDLGEEGLVSAVPLVGAPGPITLDNVPVVEGTHITATSPTVGWSAPTIGEAHGYEVRVFRLTAGKPPATEVLYTRQTHIRLPPVFMPATHSESVSYAIVVTARYDPAPGFPETRQTPVAPFGFASRATVRFTAGLR